MNLSVIIPNYNGEELLRENLPKVFEAISSHKDGKVEVIVADDCSMDNSLVEIQNTILQWRIKSQSASWRIKFKSIRNEKNLGFSSTVNRGVKEAKGEIVILLNTDVSPEKDFLEPLLRHFQDEKIFAVGCMDKSIEDGKAVLRGRGIGVWKKGFLIHSRGEVDKTNTLWVGGGSGAFKKSVWNKLGGFDDLYNPFYWEDIDLSYRALKCGYKILFEPKSIVIHEHEKGAIKKKFSSSKIKSIAYRNQFIFVWKNATDLDLQFVHLFWLPYHFIKALLRFDASFFKGFFSALVLFPKIMQFRFREQKFFVKGDHEIVRVFQ